MGDYSNMVKLPSYTELEGPWWFGNIDAIEQHPVDDDEALVGLFDEDVEEVYALDADALELGLRAGDIVLYCREWRVRIFRLED